MADLGRPGGRACGLKAHAITEVGPVALHEPRSLGNRFVHAREREAAQRGMQFFNQMNCVGCHAPNGAGGMGPSLSDSKFIYGSEPANIYLSILQGRPKGMPAWGGMLPDEVIWDLVAYIQSISKEPGGGWGKTTSADGFTTEQVPAEFMTTANPWQYTTPFSYGQAPYEKPKGSPPLETPP